MGREFKSELGVGHFASPTYKMTFMLMHSIQSPLLTVPAAVSQTCATRSSNKSKKPQLI
jgi:hypothetical protein